jgi:tRNA pseudouridine55 synthase
VGEHMQTPPAYSAVKVGGRKLYEAARTGETLVAPPRRVRVHAFDVSGFDGRDFTFRVVCSAGTYVRVLVADVGRALGCGAHLFALRRTAVGLLKAEDADAPGEAGLLPIERAVAHLPRVDLEPDEARAASNGSILGPAGIDGPYGVYARGGRLIGVYRDDAAKARPEVVLASAGATGAAEM